MLLNSQLGRVASSRCCPGLGPTQEDLARGQRSLNMDELARAFDRGKRRALVLAAGQTPLIVQRMLYFKDEMFKGMFDQ